MELEFGLDLIIDFAKQTVCLYMPFFSSSFSFLSFPCVPLTLFRCRLGKALGYGFTNCVKIYVAHHHYYYYKKTRKEEIFAEIAVGYCISMTTLLEHSLATVDSLQKVEFRPKKYRYKYFFICLVVKDKKSHIF